MDRTLAAVLDAVETDSAVKLEHILNEQLKDTWNAQYKNIIEISEEAAMEMSLHSKKYNCVAMILGRETYAPKKNICKSIFSRCHIVSKSLAIAVLEKTSPPVESSQVFMDGVVRSWRHWQDPTSIFDHIPSEWKNAKYHRWMGTVLLLSGNVGMYMDAYANPDQSVVIDRTGCENVCIPQDDCDFFALKIVKMCYKLKKHKDKISKKPKDIPFYQFVESTASSLVYCTRTVLSDIVRKVLDAKRSLSKRSVRILGVLAASCMHNHQLIDRDHLMNHVVTNNVALLKRNNFARLISRCMPAWQGSGAVDKYLQKNPTEKYEFSYFMLCLCLNPINICTTTLDAAYMIRYWSRCKVISEVSFRYISVMLSKNSTIAVELVNELRSACNKRAALKKKMSKFAVEALQKGILIDSNRIPHEQWYWLLEFITADDIMQCKDQILTIFNSCNKRIELSWISKYLDVSKPNVLAVVSFAIENIVLTNNRGLMFLSAHFESDSPALQNGVRAALKVAILKKNIYIIHSVLKHISLKAYENMLLHVLRLITSSGVSSDCGPNVFSHLATIEEYAWLKSFEPVKFNDSDWRKNLNDRIINEQLCDYLNNQSQVVNRKYTTEHARCPLCLDDDPVESVRLPCRVGHVYCRECILGQYTRTKKVRCHICNIEMGINFESEI